MSMVSSDQVLDLESRVLGLESKDRALWGLVWGGVSGLPSDVEPIAQAQEDELLAWGFSEGHRRAPRFLNTVRLASLMFRKLRGGQPGDSARLALAALYTAIGGFGVEGPRVLLPRRVSVALGASGDTTRVATKLPRRVK